MKLLKRSSFFNNVSRLSFGNMMPQVVAFVLMPLLARVYSQDDFGYYALYLSILNIAAVIATGRYELSIIVPDEKEEADSLLLLSIFIALTFGIVFFIMLYIILIFSKHAVINLNINLACILAFGICLVGICQAFTYWLSRNKHYDTIMRGKIIQSLATAMFTVLLGLSTLKQFGLIIGYVVGYLFIVLYFSKQNFKELRNKLRNTTLLKIKEVAIKYKDFPLKSGLGSFCNSLSVQIEYILFNSLYGITIVGFYYFANRLVTFPSSLLSGSTWQVFLGEMKNRSLHDLTRMVKSYQEKMIKMTILPFYSSLFILPDLVTLVFGASWNPSVIYFYPLVVALHMNLVVGSFSIFVLINRPDAEMKFNLAFVVLKIVCILSSWYFYRDIFTTVVLLCLLRFIIYTILGCWNYLQLGKTANEFLILYFNEVIQIVPYLFVLLIVKYMNFNSYVSFALFLLFNSMQVIKWGRNNV